MKKTTPIHANKSDNLSLSMRDFFVIMLTISLYLAWSAYRALQFEVIDGVVIPNPEPLWYAAIFTVVMLGVPNWRIGVRYAGYASIISVLPLLPTFNVIKDTGSLAMMLVALLFMASLVRQSSLPKMNCRLIYIIGLFLLLSFVSILSGYYVHGNSLYVKDGILRLIFYSTMCAYLIVVWHAFSHNLLNQYALFNTFYRVAVASIVIGVFGVCVILFANYHWQNDTAWGLSYFDRLKSSFSVPAQASLFFAASTCMFMHQWVFSHKKTTKLVSAICLSMVVMLVIATGSRSGKLLIFLPLIVGIMYAPYRRISIVLMVLYASAIFPTAYYRSIISQPIPFMITQVNGLSTSVTIGDLVPKKDWGEIPAEGSGNMGVTLFQDEHRSNYLFLSANKIRVNPWVGAGLGLSGKAGTDVVDPHNSIMLVSMESGIPAAIMFALLIAYLLIKLYICYRVSVDEYNRGAIIAISTAVIVILAGGAVWSNHLHSDFWFVMAVGLSLTAHRSHNCSLQRVKSHA